MAANGKANGAVPNGKAPDAGVPNGNAPDGGENSGDQPIQELEPQPQIYSSLFIFSETNPVRRFTRYVSTSKVFEYFILVAIIFNCILMAINSQLPKDDMNNMNRFVEQAETYLLGIFCLEMVLNIITMGFILHPGSYIRNAWNILDFVVVVTGILSLPQLNIMKGGSVKALRAMRVLRPLKLVSGVPSLQIVMTSIAKSLIPLSNVCLLVVFVIIIYAVIGLEMLQGTFHYTCKNETTGAILEAGRLCSSKNGRPCPTGYKCLRYWSGPNDGITSFDNILISMLTVFTCITCEGWTSTMYWSFDVLDKNGVGFWIYYYTLNIIGAQFMLNLVLGVLSGEFGKEGERLKNRAEFMAKLEEAKTERAVDNLEEWLDKGQEVAIKEEITKVKPAKEMTKAEKEKAAEQNSSLMKLRMRKFVKHPVFFWFVMTCVFLNTASVATQHYKQPLWLTEVQDIAGLVFISIFFLEMCLKFYALGFREYFKSSFNAFDAIVVCGGILEAILYYTMKVTLGISVMRALKLLKLFKFTRYWNSLKNLIGALMSSIQAILSLMVLLLLFLVIFALLGMTLFGGKFQYKVVPSRTNFDDFWNSFLAVFQVLTGEDWNAVMYEGVLANGGPKNPTGLAHSLYFVGLVIIGNYVLLNVFLAIAVDNLTEADLMGGDEDKEEAEREEKMEEVKEKYAPKAGEESKIEVKSGAGKSKSSKTEEADATVIVNEFATKDQLTGGKAKPGDNFLENLKNPGRMTGDMPGGPGTQMLQVNTLFILFPTNPIRKGLHKLVNSSWFDPFILACILISSALLALEDTVHEEATINKVLKYCDFVFTPIFALEVVLKILNYGVVLHPGAYFRDSWNFMDALVVGSAIASLVLSNDETASPGSQKIVKVLRVLRVLRPLKAVNKSKKLKAVFQCMIFSLKNVINILVITIMFLFVFSAMGVQLFVGKFFYCNDKSKLTPQECIGKYITYENFDYDQPTIKTRKWLRYDWNFDNVLNAMSTLFTSSTGEGWPAVMFNAIDATALDRGPIENNKPEVALFFIFFVIILSFFFLNIFVALIILTFQEEGAKEEGDCELDRAQRDTMMKAIVIQPLQLYVPEDETSFQGKIYRLVRSPPFDSLIMSLIIGNTILLMIGYSDQPTAYGKWLDQLNNVFNYLFTAELLLKLIAVKLNYFKDGWNVFDLIIILGSWADFIISRTMDTSKLPIDPSMFRLFRAARLIKLLNRSKTIKVLMFTFIQSFKALPYVGALIFLLFFIFCIIGMQIFSHISLDQPDEPWSEIHRQNNFRSFTQAFQILFRCATGENWPNIMLACTGPAKCDMSIKGKKPGDTCGSVIAYPYFILFIFLCSFLMLNLFVAVIMDNFAFLCQDESILGSHHLDDFLEVWAEYDPRATGRIRHTEVCNLLRQLDPPLGLGTKCPRVVVYKRMIRMNMVLYDDDTVDFNGTLFHLVRTGMNICVDDNNLKTNDIKIRQMMKRVWPHVTKKTMDRVVPKRKKEWEKRTLARVYGAKLIYENYKHLKKARKG
eukprot:Seg4389.2 transcript_id=Seg4389.2/GoldUCD/mRNA.D3Y31 product="Voltage-dependent calcium channel type A subunit alpha-1" protein_id=Seg4389.2/GoldUCD/D3Y31